MLKQFSILLLASALLSCNQHEPISTNTPVEHITATTDQAARRTQSELYCKAHQVPLYSNPNALFVNQEDSYHPQQRRSSRPGFGFKLHRT